MSEKRNNGAADAGDAASFRPSRRTLLVGSAILGATPRLASATPPADLDGVYIGGFGDGMSFTAATLKLEISASTRSGSVTLTYVHPREEPLRDLRVAGGQVSFSVSEGTGSATYRLDATPFGLAGIRTGPDGVRRASFARRSNSLSPEELKRTEGNYQFPDREGVTLAASASGFLWYRKWPSGELGILWPVGRGRFTTGPGFLVVAPETAAVVLLSDRKGAMAGLTWRSGVAQPRRAIKTVLARELAVTVVNGNVTLSGTLYLPPGSGPHPAVVLVHGSGPQTRAGSGALIRFMADAYARSGIAVVAYDKRGTGGSTGDWNIASFEELAADAVAWVRFLQNRPDIRRNFVGLSGVSQAGWIMALATKRAPDVRFVVMQSAGGAGLTVDVQERRRVELQMRADGYPESEIKRALRLRDMRDAYARTGEGWPALETYYRQVSAESWIRYQGELEPRDSADWKWLKTAFSYDPVALWREYKGSLLALFGSLDTLTPVPEARAQLERALVEGGNSDFSVVLVPRATHDFFEGRTGGDREYPVLHRLIPGYYELILGWLKPRVGWLA